MGSPYRTRETVCMIETPMDVRKMKAQEYEGDIDVGWDIAVKDANGNPVEDVQELSDINTYDCKTFIRILLHQVRQSLYQIGKTKRKMKSHLRFQQLGGKFQDRLDLQFCGNNADIAVTTGLPMVYTNKDQISSSRATGYKSADVMMSKSVEQLLDWIIDSRGSYHMTYTKDYLFDFEEYDSGNVLIGDGRECRVQGTSKV
nr:zinc finger, CCHC-type [Tanacetum cinerariifolium]